MALEATLVLIKPDAIVRGLAGAVLSRLEELELELIGAKVVRVSRALAEEHYKALQDKPFFSTLLEYIQGNLHGTKYVLAFVFQGPDAISRVRTLAGATNPEAAQPASVRGSLGRITTGGVMENVIHASSDLADAKREIKLWFNAVELVEAPVFGGHSA